MLGIGGTLLYVGTIFAVAAALAFVADAIEAASRRRRQARADARAKRLEGRDPFEPEEFSWR